MYVIKENYILFLNRIITLATATRMTAITKIMMYSIGMFWVGLVGVGLVDMELNMFVWVMLLEYSDVTGPDWSWAVKAEKDSNSIPEALS